MSDSGLTPATRTIEQAQADAAVIRAGAIIASKSMAVTAYTHNKDKLIVGWVIDRNLFESASAPLSGLKEIARGYLANAALVKALRNHVVLSVTQPGLTGDKVIAFQCDICGGEWKPDEIEQHGEGCVLSQAKAGGA